MAPLLQTRRMLVGVCIAVFDYKSMFYEEMYPHVEISCCLHLSLTCLKIVWVYYSAKLEDKQFTDYIQKKDKSIIPSLYLRNI